MTGQMQPSICFTHKMLLEVSHQHMNELSSRDHEVHRIKVITTWTFMGSSLMPGQMLHNLIPSSTWLILHTASTVLLMNTLCSSLSDNQRMGVLSEQILYLWSKAHWPYLAGYARMWGPRSQAGGHNFRASHLWCSICIWLLLWSKIWLVWLKIKKWFDLMYVAPVRRLLPPPQAPQLQPQESPLPSLPPGDKWEHKGMLSPLLCFTLQQKQLHLR